MAKNSCVLVLIITNLIMCLAKGNEENYIGNKDNLTDTVIILRDHHSSEESRLVQFLMKKYRQSGVIARPVINSSETLVVEFALALIQILDFDETNQVLTTNVWKRYRWQDEILQWDPKEFGDVDMIRIPADKIWTPDIVLYNNADRDNEKVHEALLAVNSRGIVRWIPPAIYNSACQIDMKNFPFDAQTCLFKFGSWMYDGYRLDLRFYDGMARVDIREYVNSSEWDIEETHAKRHVRYYPCCDDEPYPDLTFYLTIRRRPAFYIYVLILPSVLLSVLTLVLFWIPPQRPDRTALGMSLFSSFFVLLLILVQSSPPTSASISLLGIYYCINMVMIAVSTMLSAAVINMTYYLHKKKVPVVFRKVFIEWCGKLLCVPRDQPFKRDYYSEGDPLNQVEQLNALQKNHPLKICNVQWRILAVVMDRLMFIIYVIAITLSLVLVFPR